MEVFVEHLVKKIQTPQTTLLKVLIVIGSALLAFILFFVCMSIQAISFLGLLLAAAVIYGGWVLLRSFNVEFEYILTNNDLDVDRIIAQSRRKRLVSINMRNIEMMAPASENYKRELENPNVKTKINASTGNPANTWFIKTQLEKQGLTLILLTPDERIIAGAKTAAPRKVLEA